MLGKGLHGRPKTARMIRNDIRWLGVALLVAARAVASTASDDKSSSSHGGHPKATGAPRDSHGKIKRSPEAEDAFKKQQSPSTGRSHGACPGYVIDHVTPLKRGGADSPSNM
jgi:hypothetical protein